MHSPVSKRSVAKLHHPTKVINQPAHERLAQLEIVEKGVKYLFCGVAVMSLIAYGCMVYTQEQWKVHHRQLRKLQTQESQQAILKASLKNTHAQNAERIKSGLVAPHPQDQFYLRPTTQQLPAVVPLPVERPADLPGPVGY